MDTESTEQKLDQLVPQVVIDAIKDRVKAGVADAEAKYAINEEDEDAITGALGQAISTARATIFQTPEGDFMYEIISHKIRGRGPDAPEKKLGADAIFQVAVFNKDRKLVFAKGLPFQAKKGGGFKNAEIKRQAADLYRTSESGIVVRYSKEGYSALDVREVIDGFDKTKQVWPGPQKLSSVLGEDFFACRVGRRNLFYPPIHSDGDEKGIWAITTYIASAEQE